MKKSLKGLGCCPTSFCKRQHRWNLQNARCVSTRALLAKYVFNIMASMQSGYRRALLAKSVCTDIGCACWHQNAECSYTCCACYSPFPHDSKCYFPKWKSAATAALSAKKRNGRMLSMAAKPFILTIDSVRLFCYPEKMFVPRRII